MTYVHIEIVYGANNLTVDELWPNGDAPDEITEQAVLDLIKESGGAGGVVRDWGFYPEIHVSVT